MSKSKARKKTCGNVTCPLSPFFPQQQQEVSVYASAWIIQEVFPVSSKHVTWTSALSLISYFLTWRAGWGRRKQLLAMMQLPVCDLEDVSCHPVRPLRLFNHLPSCYVDRRSSAHLILLPRTSSPVPPSPLSGCIWPPGGPAADLSSDPHNASLEWAKSAGPLPALVHASLLMSALPSHTFANSPQF